MLLSIENKAVKTIHFVGILGAGMSAIAQFLRWEGLTVTGSDRLATDPSGKRTSDALESIGCTLVPQDGTGIDESTDAVVVSTAVENTNADLIAAKRFHVPVLHRSEVLAQIVQNKKTIAVAGTSGKSTVTAMIFELLDACNLGPSLITGAGINRLAQREGLGNAWKGTSDLLVIEADESDGSLVKYHPWMSVFLNISKDHKPESETLQLFQQLAQQSKVRVVNQDDPSLAVLPRELTFSVQAPSDCTAVDIEHAAGTSRFRIRKQPYRLNAPGMHNIANMTAALCVATQLGGTPECMANGVAAYAGIQRRFSILRSKNDIPVIDDYAHNPEKIRAALKASRELGDPVIAIFQPHGFGPTRFLKDELIAMFSECIHEKDLLLLLPIYYAGGTAAKDISSQDLADELDKQKVPVKVVSRPDAPHVVASHVTPGCCVISMGARDPSLELFAKSLVAAIDTDH